MKNLRNKGWARLHRKIEDNPLYFSEPFTKAQAWIDLFLFANHKRGMIQIRGNMIPIKRGQIGWSERTMSKRWTWSRNKVRRFIKWLETEQQIVQQKSPITTILTIIKYEEYQQDDTTNETTKRPQKDHKRYTNKNDKNDKNEKNNTNVLAKTYGNPDINEVSAYFLKVMKFPKEDCPVKQSRRYWSLLLKESSKGVEGVKWLIDLASQDEWYANNITSSKDLYYKRTKIIARHRGKTPKVAVIEKE